MTLSTKSVAGTQLELFPLSNPQKVTRRSSDPIDHERVSLELEGLKHGCGCIPLIRNEIAGESITTYEAIKRINNLSLLERSDLKTYNDRLYKSAIVSAYKATKGNKENLNEFISSLSFLFEKNEVARALVYSPSAQIEALYFAAKKLQQAYRRRSQSTERKPDDLETSRNYGDFANELKRIFVLKGNQRRVKVATSRVFTQEIDSRKIRFRSLDRINQDLIAIAKTIGKEAEMKRKLSSGSNPMILAAWILSLRHQTNKSLCN
ncbi:MAG: hypothetical protein HYR97_07155 [Candidatus Melainabacteria bacterium]|nr:hypothetical protein [Candidatus Melainabacteria bacterium]